MHVDGNSKSLFEPWYSPIVIPLRFLLLCSLLIPQSLKVTNDFMKYFLSMLIGYDLGLYDPKTNTAAIVSSSDTAEELGQINYLFTDKTGTLTQNVMEFKKCVIITPSIASSSLSSPSRNSSGNNNVKCKLFERGVAVDSLVEATTIEQEVAKGDSGVTEFMRNLVLCNTVFSSISYVK